MKSIKNIKLLMILTITISSLFSILTIYYIIRTEIRLQDAIAQVDKIAAHMGNNDTNNSTDQINSDIIDKLPAPDIKATMIGGESYDIKKISDRKKIVVFASDDCDYCKEFYPELNKFAETYSTYEVAVILPDAKQERLEELQKEHNYTFKLLSGTAETFAEYQIDFTPTTVLIDENNFIEQMAYVTKKEEMEELFFTI